MCFPAGHSSIQTSELARQSHRRILAHRCGSQTKQETEHMRYIDAFNHFFPKRIYELLLQSPAGQRDLGKRMRGIPALYDIDERLRVVECFPDYSQVICLGMPAIDRLTGPGDSPEWARIGNDGLAEMVREVSRPFRRLRRLAADERARGGGQGGRARAGQRRQRHPAPHQCRRRADRPGPVPADLRDHREIRQADPAASRSARARWRTTAPRTSRNTRSAA